MKLNLKEMNLLNDILMQKLNSTLKAIEQLKDRERALQGTDWVEDTHEIVFLKAKLAMLKNIHDELNGEHEI